MSNFSSNYLQPLEGKTALVTGASSGIGYKTACFLAEEGCHVLALARRSDKLDELKKQHPNLITPLVGDINDSKFRNQIEKDGHLKVDILINNAGLALGKELFEESKDDEIDTMMQTNVISTFKLTKTTLRHMKNQKSGDIVNITSIASHEAYKGGVTYAATKHALLAMSHALREETFGENIRIVSVSPGMVKTEFSEVRFRGDLEKAEQTYLGFKPLQAEDVAFQVLMALKCPRHVNLDEVIVLATDQAGATRLKKSN